MEYQQHLVSRLWDGIMKMKTVHRCHFLDPYIFQIMFQNAMGKYELEVTTFQMAVLFTWNQRPEDKISFESLRYDT